MIWHYVLTLCLLVMVSGAMGDDHDHSAEEKTLSKKEAIKSPEVHDHKEEGEEGTKSIGPDKGILEVSESLGFKISPEAEKNFDLQFLSVTSGTNLKVPKSAIIFSGEEKNIYRQREGFFKRLDLDSIKKSGTEYIISAKDLRAGDKIVSHGLGLLRIAEIAAGGGIEESE